MDGYDNITSSGDDDVTAINELSYLLMLFQQVKSADRIMTAIEQFTQSNPLYSPVNEWVVCGASKRGWTTWLTGAYDATRQEGSRVRGIMPVVFDDLNFQQVRHPLLHCTSTYTPTSLSLSFSNTCIYDNMI